MTQDNLVSSSPRGPFLVRLSSSLSSHSSFHPRPESMSIGSHQQMAARTVRFYRHEAQGGNGSSSLIPSTMAILMAKITIAREMITLGISVYPILALSASSWTPRGRKVEIIDPLVGIQLELRG
jgi:hypothetical protein